MRINEEKYDRQLRLWGLEGQQKLSNTTVCCFGSSAVATETLKNLVLPGIGSFVVVDDALVSKRDLGQNFFLERTDLGRPRAEAVVERLLELNPEIKGQGMGISKLGELDPEHKIVAVLTNEWIHRLEIVDFVKTHASYTVTVESLGFVARVSLYGGVHVALEPKAEEGRIGDLMIRHPWPALLEYIESFNFGPDADLVQLYHIPWLVILAKAYMTGARTRCESLNAIKILEAGRCEGLNFEEARNNVYMLTALADEEEILTDLSTIRITLVDEFGESDVSNTISGILKFYARNGRFPLTISALPDMTSDSKSYTTLVGLFKSQFAVDLDEVIAESGSIADRGIATKVVSNLHNIRLLQLPDIYGVLNESVSSPLLKRRNETEEMDQFDNQFDDPEHALIIKLLDKEFVDSSEALRQEFDRYKSGVELHSISAVAGGAAAQEIVKLITQQFVPIDNAWVFNGINGSAFTYRR
jgi:amyloid beta precursor protein binding protein 1